ncbi:hypothetical protein ACSQRM_000395, partial [Pseudomonas aeruginosa]
MTTLGRPSLGADHAITLRLNAEAINVMDAGAETQAHITGRAASRASWFRSLLDCAFAGTPPSELISALDLRQRWTDEWIGQPTDHKVTLKLTEDQRVLLRQWEFAVQSQDWTRELYRNESSLILICSQGPIFNASLRRYDL